MSKPTDFTDFIIVCTIVFGLLLPICDRGSVEHVSDETLWDSMEQ